MVLPALLIALSTQAVPDTAEALGEARRLIVEQYARSGHYLAAGPCAGNTLQDCMQGDWSCPEYSCPVNLVERRIKLIDQLEQLAPRAGHSEWLHRQRVALAVKQGRLDDARAIAETCGDAWWCLMLRGFTAHRQQPGSGLAFFDSAFTLLATNPVRLPDGRFAWGLGPDSQCVWSDIVVLTLADRASADAPCGARAAQIELFWWLADPLWTRAGNERYLEHLARHVMARMDADVMQLRAEARGDTRLEPWMWSALNLHETHGFALRQGFPNSMRRLQTRPRMVSPTTQDGRRGVPTTAMAVAGATPFVRGGYSFVPDEKRLQDPLASDARDWSVTTQEDGCTTLWTERARWASRTALAREWLGREENFETCGTERLALSATWHNIEHQRAVFRRGKQWQVVTAAHVPDGMGDSETLQPGFALGRIHDQRIGIANAIIDSARVFRASAHADSAGYLGSIEVIGSGHVARARFGLRVRTLHDGFGLSDLALVHANYERDALPLEFALLPALQFQSGDALGLYFEVYGLPEGEEVNVTLTARRTDVGLAQRVGRFLRVIGAERPVEVTWVATNEDNDNIAHRFLTLATAGFSSGDYRIAVSVRRASGQTATTERAITIR